MVDRNPHTGEKLQSKNNSDDYRNNFDYIFKPKNLHKHPLPELDEGTVMSLGEFDEGCDHGVFSAEDGTGYYGTEDGYSPDFSLYGKRPAWATIIVWFNK